MLGSLPSGNGFLSSGYFFFLYWFCTPSPVSQHAMNSLFAPSTIAHMLVLFTVLFNLIKRHSSAVLLHFPTCSTSPVHNGRYMLYNRHIMITGLTKLMSTDVNEMLRSESEMRPRHWRNAPRDRDVETETTFLLMSTHAPMLVMLHFAAHGQ